MSTEQLITAYIIDVWMDGDGAGLDADVPLVDLRIIDSAGIFDLVHYLQEEFRVTVPVRDVSPDNFRSIRAMTDLVGRLRSEGRTTR